jgi:hypothetical protein
LQFCQLASILGEPCELPKAMQMKLRDVYAMAWKERRGLGSGWIVNLEPTFNLALGAVGVMEGNEFLPETTLDQRGVAGLQIDSGQRRDDTPWQFQSNDQIEIEVQAGAKAGGKTAAPLEGACNVTVKFGREAGAGIHAAAMWWNSYADMGLVRGAIVQAARDGRLHKGESIVVTQQLTGPGILFTSQGNNASLVVTASVDVQSGIVPPVSSLAGKLSLLNSSAGAQFQSFANGTVLAARVLYLGWRGWFWWRDFEAYGALDVDRDQIEEALIRPSEGENDDEYFGLVR